MCFHWASQTLLKNSRYTQPYGTRPCYKVCVQVQGAANCTNGVRQCMKCFVFVRAVRGGPSRQHLTSSGTALDTGMEPAIAMPTGPLFFPGRGSATRTRGRRGALRGARDVQPRPALAHMGIDLGASTESNKQDWVQTVCCGGRAQPHSTGCVRESPAARAAS